MTTEETPSAQVAHYTSLSDEYWSQAKEHWYKGQLEKASELAWGSVAERVKALALARTGKTFRSHRRIGEFVERTARELGDTDLPQAFDLVERLHQNFYESDLDAEAVRARLMRVEWLLGRLDSLLTGGAGP